MELSKAALMLTLMIFAGFANAEVDPELLERVTEGHASAQFNLGLMYRKGKDVPQDNKEALSRCNTTNSFVYLDS
jgi:TPR repeat protein